MLVRFVVIHNQFGFRGVTGLSSRKFGEKCLKIPPTPPICIFCNGTFFVSVSESSTSLYLSAKKISTILSLYKYFCFRYCGGFYPHLCKILIINLSVLACASMGYADQFLNLNSVSLFMYLNPYKILQTEKNFYNFCH